VGYQRLSLNSLDLRTGQDSTIIQSHDPDSCLALRRGSSIPRAVMMTYPFLVLQKPEGEGFPRFFVWNMKENYTVLNFNFRKALSHSEQKLTYKDGFLYYRCTEHIVVWHERQLTSEERPEKLIPAYQLNLNNYAFQQVSGGGCKLLTDNALKTYDCKGKLVEEEKLVVEGNSWFLNSELLLTIKAGMVIIRRGTEVVYEKYFDKYLSRFIDRHEFSSSTNTLLLKFYKEKEVFALNVITWTESKLELPNQPELVVENTYGQSREQLQSLLTDFLPVPKDLRGEVLNFFL